MLEEHLDSSTNEAIESEVAKLLPDFRGLYSVCLLKKYAEGMTNEELSEVFGQAGHVAVVHFGDRYSSREAATKSLHLFQGRFHLCAGTVKNSDRKTNGKFQDKSRPQKSKDNKNFKRDVENKRERTYANGTGKQPETNNVDAERDGKNNIKNTHPKKSSGEKGEKKNASVNGQSTSKSRNDKKNGLKEDADMKQSSKVELFVYNIESKQLFDSMIKDYKTKAVKYFEKKNKRFAFISMETKEEADTLIEELNGHIQKERELYVRFNTRYTNIDDNISIKSDDIPSECSNEGLPTLESVQEDEMPSLEVDYSDMPSLIKDTDFHDPEGRYHIDCRVYVSHFPFQCLESQLKAAFNKYRVTDICMVNNGEASGCSRAVLYMATIYDAIKVLKEMNNSTFFGRPIQVNVPHENVLLNHILMREERRKL